MKIYWNDLFDDYIFEFDGETWLMIHGFSLQPEVVVWHELGIDANRLELVCEI